MSPYDLAVSLVLFAIQTGVDLFSAIKEKDDKENRDLIDRYMDWLRRREHAELVELVTASKDEIRRELDQQGDEHRAAASVLLSEFGDVVEPLTEKIGAVLDIFTGSALSAIPLNFRNVEDISLVGRDADLEKLRDEKEDAVLYGEPGSGKTFLLYTFAKETSALFIVTEDADKLGASIAAKKPSVVILDDAGDQSHVLTRLIHLRHDMGLSYRIIAVCWPFELEEISAIWGSNAPSHQQLELLPRQVISDLVTSMIKKAGYRPINEIIREINNQAAGRPGLAVQLTNICLKHDTKTLYDGNELRISMSRLVRKAAGDDGMGILAAFSVGGKSGLKIHDVAAVLGKHALEVSREIKNLASGGILATHWNGCVSVRPGALRRALIREHFFPPGPVSLKELYDALYAVADDKESALLSLLVSAKTGAEIPQDWLYNLVAAIDTEDVWDSYAVVSPEACANVLDNRPDLITTIPVPALYYWQDRAIEMLLSESLNESKTEDIAKIFKDWIQSAFPGKPEASGRRTGLINGAMKWLEKSGKTTESMEAIKLGFTLRFEVTETDPGEGLKMTWRHGIITQADADVVFQLWPNVAKVLKTTDRVTLLAVAKIAESWLRPDYGFRDIDNDYYTWLQFKAKVMLADIYAAGGDRHQGVVRNFMMLLREDKDDPKWLAKASPEFLALYPLERFSENYEEEEREQHDRAAALADEWAKKEPFKIAALAAEFEGMAQDVDLTWPRWSSFVFERIGESNINISEWVQAALHSELPSDMVFPLLNRMATTDFPATVSVLQICLQDERYRFIAIRILLGKPEAPAELVDVMMPLLAEFPDLILDLCRFDGVNKTYFSRLLNHDNQKVRRAAALGGFRSKSKNLVNEQPSEWKHTIFTLISETPSYSVGRIFDLDPILKFCPSLAYDVMKAKCEGEEHISFRDDGFSKITMRLSDDQRRELLSTLGENHTRLGLVRELVGDDVDLYSEVLKMENLRTSHLEPLKGDPLDPKWQEMASMACTAGHDPHDIAHGPFEGGWSISGSPVNFWQSWVEKFKQLATSDNTSLAEVGNAGVEFAAGWVDRESAAERTAKIYGRFGESD